MAEPTGVPTAVETGCRLICVTFGGLEMRWLSSDIWPVVCRWCSCGFEVATIQPHNSTVGMYFFLRCVQPLLVHYS